MTRDERSSFNDGKFETAYQEIIEEITQKFEPAHNPTDLILGGQTGAGKTALQANALFDNPNQIVINGDDNGFPRCTSTDLTFE